MNLHAIIEIIFTIVLILFLLLMVIGIMTFITFVEELQQLDVNMQTRFIFISGMAGVYLFLLRAMVDKFREFHRYI